MAEHLTNLEDLPPAGFRFSAAPVRVVGMGTFPVRAWAALAAPDDVADPIRPTDPATS